MSDNLKVPFVDLSLQFKQLQPEIDAALAKVFQHTDFVLGPAVEEFEGAFAEYCGAKHCVTVHNGTVALQLALLCLGIGKGDEVVTAANSFIATAEAIAFAGATPKLVDARIDTRNIDVSHIEQAITANTKAIMPVHLYGQPADLDAINEIAKRRNLVVIEDACQAHGALYKGQRIGSSGNLVCFSFYPGKNLGAAGDGGAIVTNDERLAKKLRLLRNHGSVRKYHHELLGHNFRLDSIQCAVLSVKLPHLDEWNEKRRRHADYYLQHLKDLPGVQLPAVPDFATPIYHLFVVQVSDRKAFEEGLKERGVGFGIHYPTPIHLQPAFAQLDLKPGIYPVSERLSQSILSLPMYPELTTAQQDIVIEAMRAVAEKLPEAALKEVLL